MLHLVTNQAINAYAILTEKLGYTEVENQISNPQTLDDEEPMIIVDTESKTLFQIDQEGLAFYTENEIELKPLTLKEIKSWEK